MASEDLLKSQGILAQNEQFETIYLAEDEIDKFMEKYLKENPDAEIETRYINQPPIELTQNIEVRWLRPETPEIPPIIIKEVDIVEPEQPPIRIVEKPKPNKEDQANNEPVIIREKPPFIVIPEPKVAYVQNVTKQKPVQQTSTDKPIKIEHIRSESQNSRIDFEDHMNRSERDPLFSFEEHQSIVDYEEEYEHRRSTIEEGLADGEKFRSKHKIYEDEHQLRLYEEKLKQTLYEEYLLRLERERLEKKLSRSGFLDERIRERSISQERMSTLSNRLSNIRIREEVEPLENLQHQHRLRQVREHEMKHHNIRERHTQSLDLRNSSDTSSYKNIKFARVTDENDLNRLSAILNNPNSLSLQTKSEADRIATSLSNLDQDAISTNNPNLNAVRTSYVRDIYNTDIYNIRQTNTMADGIANVSLLKILQKFKSYWCKVFIGL